MVHEVCEDCESICQTIGHNLEFKITISRVKCRHQYILDADLYMTIISPEMDFREH